MNIVKMVRSTHPTFFGEEMRDVGGFVGGTIVRVQTDSTRAMDRFKPIEKIQVGDMVLSKPELGEGELVYKRVVKTFEFDQKEIWYVSLSGFDDPGYTSSYMGVTPNHPFYVTGYCDGLIGRNENYTPYAKGRWQCVDQLEYGSVVINADGEHYMVTNARPFAAMKNSSLAWLQGDGYRMGWRSEPNGVTFDLSIINKWGKFQEVARGDSNDAMLLFDDPIHGYQSYLGKVYNFEVEDSHTYFVTTARIWVHSA
jgi:hypothetical protein